jgi:uracil-DNA glycosylase
MMIVRDPGGTTPARTGRLCFVCNSDNPSDRTARHAFDLWRAAVALAETGPDACRYLDRHYWCNAAMHGSDAKNLRSARRHCVGVLRDQMSALSPRVVIASGVEAATSLYELGFLKRRWQSFRGDLAGGAYQEEFVGESGGIMHVFCTYHTAATGVNYMVSRLYTERTESLLAKRRDSLDDAGSFDAFLARYSPASAEGRGMRVLLLHWLGIGGAVREAYGQA